jgi:hypothetical protein
MPASEKSARSLREKVCRRYYLLYIYFVEYTQGMVLCDPALPVPVTTKFQAKIVVFSIEVPITKGIARIYKFFVLFYYTKTG